MGGTLYFRFTLGVGRHLTFVTSVLQLYTKDRPDLHTLYVVYSV